MAYDPSAPPAGGVLPGGKTPFEQYIEDNELSADVATDLGTVLNTTRVVLLLDDSGSMKTRVVPPGQSAIAAAGPPTTRWSAHAVCWGAAHSSPVPAPPSQV